MSTDNLFWDKLAERYAKQPIANLESYERKLDVTKSRLSPTDVILDIGCGTGSLALELAPHVAAVHALDFSGEMIRVGKRKASDQNVTNITFHQSTLEAVEGFQPGQFDGICACNILHLVEDRADTLQRVFAYLKPGGFFISSTACLGESFVPYQPILAVMRWLGKAPPVRIFSAGALLHDIRDAGFIDISTPDVGAKKLVAFAAATKPR
jgi:ubiquinone/menaquinone biosynthesis C-methylase UbiE